MKINAFNLIGYYTNTIAPIFVYKFRPERTGFNAEYATALNFPCFITLALNNLQGENSYVGFI